MSTRRKNMQKKNERTKMCLSEISKAEKEKRNNVVILRKTTSQSHKYQKIRLTHFNMI